MKLFKMIVVVVVCMCTAIGVFAGPPRGGRGHHRGPRPYGGHHHHHRHHGNDGVWLAAGITHIVANGLGIVRQVTAPPVYAAPAPVYVQPTVVYPPVVQDPIPAPTYYPPVRQEWRNIPIYDPYGRIIGYRQVLMDVK